MAGMKVLEIIKPFAGLIPEIELPYEKIIFDEKIVYTIGAAVIYLLSSIPISGVNPNKMADPFYWLRLPFASEAGTLLEFGVLPVVTSAFLWQILSGLKIVQVNFSNVIDRQHFQSLQKVFAVLIAVFYAALLSMSGYFQPVDSFSRNSGISAGASFLIVCQLGTSTAIITLLVELLEKGYGFGPGVLAFIAANSATKLAGSLFGIMVNPTTGESNGVFIQFFRNIFSKSIPKAVYSLFTRTDEINFTQVYLTIIVLAIITFLQNFRMDISIKSSKVRSMVSSYPIRFLYCGALPILFTYSVLYNLNIVIFALTKIFGGSKYIAVWQLNAITSKTYDLSCGVLYFLSSSPLNNCVFGAIIKYITFTLYITLSSSIFGRYWFTMSGSSGKDLAKQFKDQDIVVVGHRDANVAKELNKMITSASLIGSTLLGLTIGLAETTTLSQGYVAGIAVGVLAALSLLEQIMTEYQQAGAANSQFAQVFGTN